MSREAHVRFYEGRGVKLPPATHLKESALLRRNGVAGDGAPCYFCGILGTKVLAQSSLMEELPGLRSARHVRSDREWVPPSSSIDWTVCWLSVWLCLSG